MASRPNARTHARVLIIFSIVPQRLTHSQRSHLRRARIDISNSDALYRCCCYYYCFLCPRTCECQPRLRAGIGSRSLGGNRLRDGEARVEIRIRGRARRRCRRGRRRISGFRYILWRTRNFSPGVRVVNLWLYGYAAVDVRTATRTTLSLRAMRDGNDRKSNAFFLSHIYCYGRCSGVWFFKITLAVPRIHRAAMGVSKCKCREKMWIN